MKDKIHFGELIYDELITQGRSITWLALQLECDYSTLARTLKKEHIRTDQLFKISKILNCDFFAFGTLLISENK